MSSSLSTYLRRLPIYLSISRFLLITYLHMRILPHACMHKCMHTCVHKCMYVDVCTVTLKLLSNIFHPKIWLAVKVRFSTRHLSMPVYMYVYIHFYVKVLSIKNITHPIMEIMSQKVNDLKITTSLDLKKSNLIYISNIHASRLAGSVMIVIDNNANHLMQRFACETLYS